ncbi:MAG: DUF1616 domain-containing protein [Actinobacteria bacterium]|nr:DUF1616 domain-containing protein [Actinomycetota bacterium]
MDRRGIPRYWDLHLAAAPALATTVVTIALPLDGPIRVAIAVTFVLFLPGYLATAALFPRAADLSGPERLALSLGLSLAIVPLVGLALNFSPWGIRLEPIVLSLDLLAALLVGAIAFQRGRLGDDAFVPDWPAGRAPSRGDVLTVALVGLSGIGRFVVVRLTLGESQPQRFTEFAMVGPSGTLSDLPVAVAPGAQVELRLMVTSHEGIVLDYRIRPSLDGRPLAPVEVGPLADEAAWEQPFSVRAPWASGRHELAFDLERLDAPGAYRHLSLKLEVSPAALRSQSPTPPASIIPSPGLSLPSPSAS